MTFEASPKQALFLFGIIFGRSAAEREPMQSKTQPPLSTKERAQLVKAGLIEKDPRTKPRATFLRATDATWDWASTHLGAELSKAQAAGPILQSLLTRLGSYLDREGLALATLFSQDESENDDLSARVRAAVLKLGGGRPKQRVRLAALRRHFGELPRQTFDALLGDMQNASQIILYRLDNPAELSRADHDAALLVAGNPRHLVYLES